MSIADLKQARANGIIVTVTTFRPHDGPDYLVAIAGTAAIDPMDMGSTFGRRVTEAEALELIASGARDERLTTLVGLPHA